jgi:hypothetical protein
MIISEKIKTLHNQWQSYCIYSHYALENILFSFLKFFIFWCPVIMSKKLLICQLPKLSLASIAFWQFIQS